MPGSALDNFIAYGDDQQYPQPLSTNQLTGDSGVGDRIDLATQQQNIAMEGALNELREATAALANYQFPPAPSAPSLSGGSLAVPPAPSVGSPPSLTFSIGTLDPPKDVQLVWGEVSYPMSEVYEILSYLQEWVRGAATGLDPAVEARLWDRARVREFTNTKRGIETAMTQAAARGWRRPPGAMYISIERALDAERDALSGVSREIAIKQADLEQTNRHFAFKQAWDVHSGLINYEGDKAGRALDAAKFAAQLVNDTYKAMVEGFVGRIRGYADMIQAQASAYAAQVGAQAQMMTAQAAMMKAQADVIIGYMMVEVEYAKIAGHQVVATIQAQAEILKATMMMAAQIAAAMASQQNYSTSLSSSDAWNRSESYSNSHSDSVAVAKSSTQARNASRNFNENHNYSHDGATWGGGSYG